MQRRSARASYFRHTVVHRREVDLRAPWGQIPRGRLTRSFSAAAAWLVVGLAVVGVVGWLARLPVLVQVVPRYPPLYPNTAIGLLGTGLALLGITTGREETARFGASVALVIGVATLLEYGLNLNLGIDRIFLPVESMSLPAGRYPGRMPATSALCLLQAGLGLLALLAESRTSTLALLAGVAGATVGALGATVLLGYLSGTLAELRHGFVAGMAVHDSTGFFLLGTAMVAIAWQHDRPVKALPIWFAPAMGIAGLTTSVLVWQALASRERERLDERLSAVADVTRQSLASVIDGLVKDLDRLARRTTKLPPAVWAVDAEAAMGEVGSYQAVAWREPDGTLRWVIPRSAAGLIAQTLPPIKTAPVDTVRLSRYPTSLISAELVNDERLLGVRVAVCDGSRCQGDLVGLFNLAGIFRAGLGPASSETCLSISTGGRALFDRGGDCQPGRSRSAYLAVGRMSWTLTVAPTEAMIGASGSTLPAVILALGVLVSCLLATSLRLAQRSWELARQVERRQVTRAIESATDGIWEWQPVIDSMTRGAMWRGLGYRAAELPTSRSGWESLVHPEDLEAVRSAIAAHLAGKTDSLTMEYRLRAAGGRWHWIVDRARVIERTAWGTPARVLGIYADITERRAAAAALQASEERFRAIFDSAFQFQALLDLDCTLLLANRTALDFAGVRLEDVRGRYFWDTRWWSGSGERQARLQGACRAAASGKTIQYQEEVDGADGRRATVEFSVKPVRTRDGRVTQLLAEGRDVTERKRAEDALRELDTLSTMGRLAARVAHEINNPLAGIQNSFTLIKDAVPVEHPYYRYVGAIEREIERIAGVTRELYGLYRAEHASKRQSSVGTAISDAVDLLEQVNRRAGVQIRVDVTRAPPLLPFPDALIRQVVFNLVQNAVEASPPQETVFVTGWADQSRFNLSVRDRGPGIPPPLRQRIFEDFYSTKSGLRTGGMGLGLSIVQNSVRALGGEIEIQDPAGGGAEFIVRLPFTEDNNRYD